MNNLGALLSQAKQIDMLTPEQEQELADTLKNGSANEKLAARNTLVQANIRFVASLGYRYSKTSNIPVEDYVSAGLEAMVRNADKFDPAKGGNFLTFIKPWIRKAMQEVYQGQTNIVIPRHKHIAMGKVRTATERLVVKLGPMAEITNEMIAEESGMKVSEVESCLVLRKTLALGTESLDAPVAGDKDGNSTLGEHVSGDLVHIDRVADFSIDVTHALESLDDEERQILLMSAGLYDGQKHSIASISRTLGVKKERVSKALASAKTSMANLL